MPFVATVYIDATGESHLKLSITHAHGRKKTEMVESTHKKKNT